MVVSLYPDGIETSDPAAGALMGDRRSIPRNRELADPFHDEVYTDVWGEWVREALCSCEESGVPCRSSTSEATGRR